MEKKLYAISDFSLPVPIPLRVLGVFVLVAVPWWVFVGLIHIPFSSPWYLIWIVPPGAVAYFGSRPIFEGKTLMQYARSRIQFLLENKKYKGLTPDFEDKTRTIEVKQTIFTR